MSLLDQVLASLTSATTKAGGPLVAAFLEHEGGVEAVVAKFKNGGLSEVVNSWISTGENKPVSAEQIQSVLGNETVSKLAAKVGLDPAKLSAQLASALPEIIDRLSPNGKLNPPGGAHG